MLIWESTLVSQNQPDRLTARLLSTLPSLKGTHPSRALIASLHPALPQVATTGTPRHLLAPILEAVQTHLALRAVLVFNT